MTTFGLWQPYIKYPWSKAELIQLVTYNTIPQQYQTIIWWKDLALDCTFTNSLGAETTMQTRKMCVKTDNKILEQYSGVFLLSSWTIVLTSCQSTLYLLLPPPNNTVWLKNVLQNCFFDSVLNGVAVLGSWLIEIGTQCGRQVLASEQEHTVHEVKSNKIQKLWSDDLFSATFWAHRGKWASERAR